MPVRKAARWLAGLSVALAALGGVDAAHAQDKKS